MEFVCITNHNLDKISSEGNGANVTKQTRHHPQPCSNKHNWYHLFVIQGKYTKLRGIQKRPRIFHTVSFHTKMGKKLKRAHRRLPKSFAKINAQFKPSTFCQLELNLKPMPTQPNTCMPRPRPSTSTTSTSCKPAIPSSKVRH